jgi:hypothetical protein
MAIEVASEHPVDPLETVCEGCRYKLRYAPVDIQSRTNKDYGGGGTTAWWIVCPRCRTRTDVEAVYLSREKETE